jgi:hypothetical protein
MLQRQIKNYELDIENIKERITREKFQLRMYLAEKEGFYQAIRKLRKGQKQAKE